MVGDIALILLFVVAALALRGLSLSTRRRAAELAAMDHTSIEDLHGEAAAVREQLGRGALNRPCKVMGVARPDGEPLTGPISGQPVLWYDAKVIHHYWKDHYKTDKHGNQQHSRTRHKEILSHEVSSNARVLIDDGTGQVAVSLSGARLDGTRKLVDQMRPHPAMAGRGQAGSSTIGYSHIEMALVPGEPLFITGQLREQPIGDGLEIVGDSKKGPVVSTKTEAEVIAGRHRVAAGQMVAAVVCGVIAVIGTVSTVGEAFEDEPATAALATDSTTPARVSRPSPSPSPAPTRQPSASPAPPPPTASGTAVSFTMPDLVGVDLQTAQDTVQTYGIFYSSSHDLAGSRTQVLDSNWRVCSQTPAPGTHVQGDESSIAIDFGVVRREESCP